jgi:hypothetical protein
VTRKLSDVFVPCVFVAPLQGNLDTLHGGVVVLIVGLVKISKGNFQYQKLDSDVRTGTALERH